MVGGVETPEPKVVLYIFNYSNSTFSASASSVGWKRLTLGMMWQVKVVVRSGAHWVGRRVGECVFEADIVGVGRKPAGIFVKYHEPV